MTTAVYSHTDYLDVLNVQTKFVQNIDNKVLLINKNNIQRVFPHLDSSTRESMISGTHPLCWDEIFINADEELFVEDYNEIISNWEI